MMDRIVEMPGGTAILLKDAEPEIVKPSWMEVLLIAGTVFGYGFLAYILLLLRVEGML